MQALQDMAEKLVDLNPKQLAQTPMSDTLRKGVVDCQGFKKEARRRQLQYLGKLMRSEEVEPIREKLESFDTASKAANAKLHALETLRQRLIDDDKALTEFLEDNRVDVQALRQLIRAARAEKPGATRSLFKFLRDSQAD